jgi:hypothetical protein
LYDAHQAPIKPERCKKTVSLEQMKMLRSKQIDPLPEEHSMKRLNDLEELNHYKSRQTQFNLWKHDNNVKKKQNVFLSTLK